jgi:hypothetical protein
MNLMNLLNELTKLFDSLILSLFYYAIEVWGSALQAKYIDKFNKFLNRAFRYGYTQNKYSMAKMIEERDLLLFNKVMHNPEHCLYELLPEERRRPLRERDHQFMLPKVYTERFKQSFLNKCLFNDFCM